MTLTRVWLIVALLAGAATAQRAIALIASASEFPGVSVLGILEVLVPAELAVLCLLRWRDVRTATRRRWGWLLPAAFSSLVALLLIGTAALASRPAGLSPSGLAIALAATAFAAFAWWRSRPF